MSENSHISRYPLHLGRLKYLLRCDVGNNMRLQIYDKRLTIVHHEGINLLELFIFLKINLKSNKSCNGEKIVKAQPCAGNHANFSQHTNQTFLPQYVYRGSC